MKRIIVLCVLTILYSVNASEKNQLAVNAKYFRPIKAEVQSRHDVLKWHADLIYAVMLNKPYQVSLMLVNAGEDASELVCTASSAYGPILRTTYIENKPELRNLLKKYMDEDYCKQCFEEEKLKITSVITSTKYVNKGSLAAEKLIHDFHMKNPKQYPLSPNEQAYLGIK